MTPAAERGLAIQLIPRKFDDNQITRFLDQNIVSAVESEVCPAISADRPLVIEVGQAVVGEGFGVDGCPGGWRLRQAPGTQVCLFFQHEIPMENGMIVRQNDKTWHGCRFFGHNWEK